MRLTFPEIIQFNSSEEIFSTSEDGYNLSTLYNKGSERNYLLMLIKCAGSDTMIGYFSSERYSSKIKTGYHVLYYLDKDGNNIREYNSKDCHCKLFMSYKKDIMMLGIGDEGKPAIVLTENMKNVTLNSSDLFTNPLLYNKDQNIIEIQLYTFDNSNI